ncbi:MAG: small multi-drug export protein [Candidatus Peribacteraceae bacterium]|nr:small multi-drug export protein [Candidatus Peribacteraceae bacterium]
MLPPAITTFLFAMTPIFELRGALPWGATIGGLSLTEAFCYSVVGNIFIAILLVLLLPKFTNFTKKYWPGLFRVLQKIFTHTRAKHSKKFERFAEVALVILVAIPLPGSGGWTGAMVAWLFGFKKKTAIALISLGIIIAGLLVAGITSGALTLAQLF